MNVLAYVKYFIDHANNKNNCLFSAMITDIFMLMKIYFLVMQGKWCRIPTSRPFSSPVPTGLGGHVMSHQNSPSHTGHKLTSILLFLHLYL